MYIEILAKTRPGLPAAVREFIKHLFMELSDEKLLVKCLHGKTQNSNVSINSVMETVRKRYFC